MGAAALIDYTVTDPVEAIGKAYPDGVEALIDLVGIPDLSAGLSTLVHEGGHVVSVVMPPDVEGLAARGVEGILTTRYAAEDRFPEIADRIFKGELKVPTIQTFALE